jgi:hypothetical protein
VYQRAQVQQLDCRRAGDRGVTVSTLGQRQHQAAPMAGPGRGGRPEQARNGFTEAADDFTDQAIDVAQQERLVRHGA